MVEAEERRTIEEYVIQQQTKFEQRILQSIESRLPDAVRGREIYIYRKLMRDWFNKLTAQSRYDETQLKKFRMDWLIYMETLERSRTSNFLSLESKDEKTREKYDRAAHEQKMRVKAIEDAYAEAIGSEAVAELRRIREKEYDSFSDAGDLAPEGHYYTNISLRGVPNDPIPRRSK